MLEGTKCDNNVTTADNSKELNCDGNVTAADDTKTLNCDDNVAAGDDPKALTVMTMKLQLMTRRH